MMTTLAAAVLAACVGSGGLLLTRADGVSMPSRVTVEWLAAADDVIALASVEGTVSEAWADVGRPPDAARFVRVVGPDVISLPVAVSRCPEIRLLPASYLRLTRLPPGQQVRLFMQLRGTEVRFARTVDADREGTAEVAVPVGTFAVAVDAGLALALQTVGELSLAPSAVTRVTFQAPGGTGLSVEVHEKESGRRLSGATLRPRLTPEFPLPFWTALATRCPSSDADGLLACGVVPTALGHVEVGAPERRSARAALAAKDQTSPLMIRLPHYQTLAVRAGITNAHAPELTTGLVATLARCENLPCEDARPRSAVLGPDGETTFARVSPGVYRLSLRGEHARSSTTPLVVSAEAAAPAVLEVALDLSLYGVHGSTRLSSGEGVPARVSLGTLVEGQKQFEYVGEVASEEDGTFESWILAPSGAWLVGRAKSDAPPAEGEVLPPGVRLVDGAPLASLPIELSIRGSTLKLVDRQTGAPVVGCRVAMFRWSDSDGGVRVETTDADGFVRWLGVESGTFVARASCEGYRPASTREVELSDGDHSEVLELDRAARTRLRVRDANGAPLAGAMVYAEQSRFQSTDYPFRLAPDVLGATNLEGELDLPPHPRDSLFVVAQGQSLWVGRRMSCAGGCNQDVVLSRPVPFPGIRVRDAAGKPRSAAWLLFSKEGVAIPVQLQTEVALANGAKPGLDLIVSDAEGSVHMLPWYLAPGVYDIEYAVARAGAAPLRVPLGRVSVPSTARIEFTLPPLESVPAR